MVSFETPKGPDYLTYLTFNSDKDIIVGTTITIEDFCKTFNILPFERISAVGIIKASVSASSSYLAKEAYYDDINKEFRVQGPQNVIAYDKYDSKGFTVVGKR